MGVTVMNNRPPTKWEMIAIEEYKKWHKNPLMIELNEKTRAILIDGKWSINDSKEVVII